MYHVKQMPRRNPNHAQVKHPITGRWWLLDTSTGRVQKSRVARWVDVPVILYDPAKHTTSRKEQLD